MSTYFERLRLIPRFCFGAIVILLLYVSCFSGCGNRQAGAQTRTDGAELLYATKPPPSAQNPAFSPDGDVVLFTVFHDGYNEGQAGIYVMKLDGSKPVKLLDESGHDSVNAPGSSWSEAAGRITFSSDRKQTDEIWKVTPNGGDLSRVTRHDTATHYIEPSFSPDGSWIVFEEDLESPEEEQHGSIWKVRADGTEPTKLTDGPAGGTDDRQPNWSPRGNRILFQRRWPGTEDWNIYTMNPDGSDTRQVTTDPAEDTDASWSPDGLRIVYSTDQGDLPHPNIFVVSANGGTPVRITRGNAFEDGAPSWSPDGEWIAFESHKDEDSPSSLWRISAPHSY